MYVCNDSLAWFLLGAAKSTLNGNNKSSVKEMWVVRGKFKETSYKH